MYLMVAPYCNVCHGLWVLLSKQYAVHMSPMLQRKQNAVIIFDGYGSGPTTKDTAHLRRTRGVTGTKVYFTETTPFSSKKEHFLSYSENKQEFILIVSRLLEAKGYSTVHAEGDVDLLIVKTDVRCSGNQNKQIHHLISVYRGRSVCNGFGSRDQKFTLLLYTF